MSTFFNSLFLEPVARRFSFPAWAGQQQNNYPASQDQHPRISSVAQTPYRLFDEGHDREELPLCINEIRCPRTLTRHTRIPTFAGKARTSRAHSCPDGPPYTSDNVSKSSKDLEPGGNEAIELPPEVSGLRRAFASEANLTSRISPLTSRSSRKKRRRQVTINAAQPEFPQTMSDPRGPSERSVRNDDDGWSHEARPLQPVRLINSSERLCLQGAVRDNTSNRLLSFQGHQPAALGSRNPIVAQTLPSVAGIHQDLAATTHFSNFVTNPLLPRGQTSESWDLSDSRVGATNIFPLASNVTRDSDESTRLSESLPANDGMANLRQKMHEIRELAISSEERARRMHALMMADYNGFKGFQHETQKEKHGRLHRRSLKAVNVGPSGNWLVSPDPKAEYGDTDSLHSIGPADFEPSYQPCSPEADSEDSESTASSTKDEIDTAAHTLGCAHYKRNVKIQCVDCRHWYPCRHCHDEVEDHVLVRKKVRNMLCMKCRFPQRAAEYCTQCDEQAAIYYCDICKLWDNDAAKKIYHCEDCGICRIGEGLGKDYLHCKRCNVCVSMNHVDNHRCVERATDCNCPICGDYMFTSSASIVAMRCGHYIHRKCYDAFMETAYKCPVCNRSAVNMELQWRKMDHSIAAQPMPDEYKETRAMILCNDCSTRGLVPFHWLGNKCRSCDSYNTNQLHLVNAPGQEQIPGTSDSSFFTGQNSDTGNLSPNLTHESQIPPAPLPIAANSSTTPASRLLDAPNDSTEDSTSGSHVIPAVSALNVTAETESQETQSQAPISSPIPRAADPQPEPQRSSVEPESRPITAHNTDDEEDDAGFWGESISPSRFVPSGWGSPTLFASSSNDEDTERASSLGSGNSGWPFDPRQWRIGSPFFGSRSAKSDDGDARVERKQERDEDFEFYEEEEENGTFAWPINPSAWRLSSPGFFAASAKGEQPIEPSQPPEASKDGRVTSAPMPSSWPINPSSLLEGFSSPRFLAASNSMRNSLSTSEQVNTEPIEVASQSPFAGWGLNVPTPGLLLARRLSGWGEGRIPLWNNELSTANVREQDDEDESSSEDERSNSPEDDDGLEEDEVEELDLVGHR